ncbi:hypothetical protein TYRP_019822 [Tyrophagus putrescentiae]|nr:hypothetical protein TYRP_019822 [Tyrophagus putrescentiae]
MTSRVVPVTLAIDLRHPQRQPRHANVHRHSTVPDKAAAALTPPNVHLPNGEALVVRVNPPTAVADEEAVVPGLVPLGITPPPSFPSSNNCSERNSSRQQWRIGGPRRPRGPGRRGSAPSRVSEPNAGVVGGASVFSFTSLKSALVSTPGEAVEAVPEKGDLGDQKAAQKQVNKNKEASTQREVVVVLRDRFPMTKKVRSLGV